MQIAERLKSERKRLGYSQEAFAVVAEAVRGTAYNWEKGTGFPTADALAAWASVGLDVLYVVTGSHSFVPPPRLSSEEQTLLDYYQEAGRDARKAALRALLAAGEAPSASPSVSGSYNRDDHRVSVRSTSGKVNINQRGK